MRSSQRSEPNADAAPSQSPKLRLRRLEDRLGYRFEAPALLRRALTHKSAGTDNFERFEFLGDAALGFVVGQMLFEANADDSQHRLTIMRANLVNGAALADVARELDLGQHLILGAGVRKGGGANQPSMLADAFEAVLGAIVCDSGIDAAAIVIRKLFSERIETQRETVAADPKTRLQEHLQGRRLDLPEYLVQQSGVAHAPIFSATCRVAALSLSCRGQGGTRREAEKAAAAAMLCRLAEDTSMAVEDSSE